jgi:hypothetical protein
MNQEQRVPVRELIFLTLGEAVCVGLIIAAFLILKKFDYTVVTGAILGASVIVFNFVFLCISVNRAFDRALNEVDVERLRAAAKAVDEARETGDESAEEEKSEALEKITAPNSKRLSNAIRVSYLLRTVTMLAALVVALITKQFNVIATAVPLFMQRPLLTLAELTKKKKEG